MPLAKSRSSWAWSWTSRIVSAPRAPCVGRASERSPRGLRRCSTSGRASRARSTTVCSRVTGIALQLRAMLPHVTPADTLHRIVELADRTSHEARRAIWDLRSPSVADDITGALEDAARRHLAGTSLAYRLTVTGRPRALSPSVIPVAVRIMEEGLTNVVKHAGATSIWLTVAYERRLVRITLADDGHGFDLAGAREGHWGIVGMQERADEIGGRLRLRSAPESGTEVVLAIPINPRGELSRAGERP